MSGGPGPPHSCHLLSPGLTSLVCRIQELTPVGELEAISTTQCRRHPQAAEDTTR